jgi:hypothetical protein
MHVLKSTQTTTSSCVFKKRWWGKGELIKKQPPFSCDSRQLPKAQLLHIIHISYIICDIHIAHAGTYLLSSLLLHPYLGVITTCVSLYTPSCEALDGPELLSGFNVMALETTRTSCSK